MFKDIKKFTIFAIAGMSGSIIQIVSMLFLIKFMSIEEVSLYSYIFALITLIASISMFGLDSSSIYFMKRNQSIESSSIYFNCILIITILYLFFYFIIILFIEENVKSIYTFIWGISLILYQFNLSWAKYNLSNATYCSINFIQVCIFICGCIYININNIIIIENIILLFIIANLLSISVLYIREFKYEILKFNFLTNLINFSIPYAILSICTILIFSVDKIILYKYISKESYALYFQQVKVASFFTFYISISSYAISPILVKKFNEENFNYILNKYYNIYFLSSIVIALNFLAVYKLLLLNLLDVSYINNIEYIPFYLYISIIYGEYIFIQSKILSNNINNLSWKPSLMALSILAIVNFITINYLGIYGCILSIYCAIYSINKFSLMINLKNNKLIDLLYKRRLIFFYFFYSTIIIKFEIRNILIDSIIHIFIVNLLIFIFFKYIYNKRLSRI